MRTQNTEGSIRRLLLIGQMGSGKSAVGKPLSEALALPFLDLDAYLEAASGRSIASVFAEAGETAFRQMERFYLREILDQYDALVLATGGGTPCFYDNMAMLQQAGCCIYLQTPVAVLVERLVNETQHRPLLADRSKKQLQQFLEGQLEARAPFYEQAQLLVDGSLPLAALVQEIVDVLKLL